MDLKSVLAGATAAAAAAVVLTGPVVKVLGQVERREHPTIQKFEGVAGKYREVLAWED